MFKELLKKHKTGFLVGLVVALFVTAGLVFGQIVDFSSFTKDMTGSLVSARRYGFVQRPSTQRPFQFTFARCGDGIVTKPETCDDKNIVNGDGCSSKCTFEITSGASATNITSNSVTLVTPYQAKVGEFYNGSCAPFTGVEESGISKTLPVTVGNLKPDTDYACRINVFPSATGGQTIGMSNEVKFRTGMAASKCGNKIVESGEACDDGNMVSGDGCSSTCQVEVTGTTNPPQSSSVCGNGKVEGAETCDDKNNVNGDGCSATCQIEVAQKIGTLTVSKAAVPVSQTYVKGEKNVPALGVTLTAGNEGDLKLNKVSVRAYSSFSPDFGFNNPSNLGTVAANTLVSSVMLYSGNDVVGGPTTLSLVDISPAGYNYGSDYYVATFDNLGLSIGKGSSMVLTAKVNLLNTPIATQYLALDMDPAKDIVAMDLNGNAVLASGKQLNLTNAPNPMVTVLTQGVLSVSATGNLQSATLTSGTSMNLVAKYRLSALHEGFNVEKMTIINDAVGAFDKPESTATVSKVVLKYSDVNGVSQTTVGALAAGTLTLSNLSLYAPAGQDSYVEIYADVSSTDMVGPTIGGQSFRLGIQTVSAIGATSNTMILSPVVTNAESVPTFTVALAEQPKLIVAKSPGTMALTTGENVLLSFTLTAGQGSSATITKIGFAVSGTVQPSEYRLFRNGELLPIQPSMTVVTSGASAAATSSIQFDFSNQPATVAAEYSQNYTLRGSVTNAALDDIITTTLAEGKVISDASVQGLPISQTLTK